MADIVIAIASEVAKALVKPAIRQGQYLFCVNKVIRNLDNEKKELISKRDSILSLVEQIQRTEIIEDSVNEWLNDVKSLLEEVEKLEKDVKESGCFQGWCPTWRRYRLCREISKKTERITAFKNRERFEPFSHSPSLPGIEYDTSKNFTYFKSTKVAYNQLLEALKDDDAYMIGLYGMGGSGKTILATEVGEKAKSEINLFDHVISVTVSQTPNIRSIQGKMADMLNLKLKQESEEGRARQLWLRLKAEKRVLIIVDDVWAKFNLKEIGICLDDNKKLNFKVLLTTRQRQVCVSMDCQQAILLDLLTDNEAWSLFRKHAGIGDGSSSNHLKLAREVSDQCRGLPIAIEAVGSSLKGKGNAEWKVALESLRHSEPFDDHEEEGMRHAIASLKLSYDYLENKVAKMLFLMCSMFPEDHEIFIEDLIRYGVGLGVCGNLNSFNLARNQIIVGINKLIDSCLLLCSRQREHHVKMHDVVRDAALWIASRSNDRKILFSKDLNALVDNGAVKDYFAISSWYTKIDLISHQLDAPKLEILLLQIQNMNSKDFSFASSDGVKEFKVMSILNSYYSRSLLLFQSTQWLTNLRTLHLRGWNLGDLSFVISLTRLEALELQHCDIKELPKGMEKLDKLKLMDLSDCDLPENFNYEALGSFSQLEELYVSHRTCPSEVIKDIVNLPNLRRFVIQFGWFQKIDYEECIRVLHLREFSISNLGVSKQNLLQRAKDVSLVELHGGCKNIIPDMVRLVGDMKELTNLGFRYCSEIECLIDTTHHHAGPFQVDTSLPGLVKLELSEMDNLKEVCRGPPSPVLGFFKKLEQLIIKECQQLHSLFPEACNLCNLKILKIENYGGEVAHVWKFNDYTTVESLFSMAVAQSLQQLEELLIEDCKKLKHIITSEGEGGTNTGDNSQSMFPNLKKILVNFCPKLEFIFPISFALQGHLQLQEIKIYNASKLKYVFFQHDHEAYSSQQNQIQIMLAQLKVFELHNLENLLGICPKDYDLRHPSLVNLSCRSLPKLTTSYINAIVSSKQRQQHLNRKRQVFWLITTSSSLEALLNLEYLSLTNIRAEGIFELQVEGEASNNSEWKPWKSNLADLYLRDLPELRFIWNGFSKFMSLENLQNVSLVKCPKLKTIFALDIVKFFPNLWNLSISNCEELEEIISSDSENAQLKPSSSHPKQEVCFPRLYNIEVKQCNKLKCLFYDSITCHFPELEFLEIKECSQLEQTFGFKIEGGDKSFQREASEDGNLILFPKLDDLIVMDCPKYRLTSRESSTSCQHVTTQKGQVFWLITASSSLQAFLNLGALHLTKSRAECIFQLQVEGEISGNNEWTPLNSSLRHLRLHDLPELRFIWKNFSKFLSLEKLIEVSLVDCPQLKTIFTSYIVRCLPNLQRLLISNCEKLEEIMSSDLENTQLRHPTACPPQEVCFPRLIKIEVKQCNKLKCLFYESMPYHFPKLKSLEIEECTQIEQVFGSKGRADDESSQRWANEDGERILLPKLQALVLRSLPIFFEISRGFNLSQPMPKYLVTDCP